jgi:DNA-binding NarL/FixJ family response regulator
MAVADDFRVVATLAIDSDAVIAAVRARRPDVVVIDLLHDLDDGLRLLRSLAASGHHAVIALVITSWAAEFALGSGASQAVVKVDDPEVILGSACIVAYHPHHSA